MATFEWGSSKWDIDKAAKTLNKDLFGDKKMKKRVLVPDNTVDKKDSHGAQDSDEEQLSKKAKKRLKERMRKKKKRAGVTVGASSENQTKSESKDESRIKQRVTKETADEGRPKIKKRKKKNKNFSEKLSDGEVEKRDAEKSQNDLAKKNKKFIESDGKDAMPALKTTGKPKKRKTPDSGMANEDVTAKKMKISDSVEENNGEPQKKRRNRLNRKKRNNSKKNKYKHLALNSKTQTDAGDGISNGHMKNVSAENESKTSTPNKDTKKNISKSPGQTDKDSQPETNTSPQQKNKEKRKKTKKVKNIDNSPRKELSENLNQSSSQKGNDMEHESNSREKKEKDNGKTRPRIDKQRLLDMLNHSTSDSVHQSADDESSVKEKKRKKRKRKDSQSENTNSEQSVADKPSNALSGSDSFVHGSHDPASNKMASKWLSNTAEELKDKATEKLKAARFRFINEQLYNCKGHEALQLFRKDVEAFQVYHQGFQSQTRRWPVNPLDAIIKHVNKRPKQLVVADFGCGDARLSESVPQKVHSFDLVALNDRVTACDMSKTPLADDSIDIAVFCLSLMGTNLNDYILEANRVLKTGGLLKIAEVVSRFQNPDQFIKHVSSLGFLLLNRRELSDMFYLMDFKKVKRMKKSPINVEIQLKACVYKKR